MSKQTKPAIVINGDLLTIAKRIGATIKNADKLAITLGKLARDAAPMIKDEKTLDAFIAECRKQCKGASDSSVKTYLSMVRGVLRAAVDGWTMPDDDSIKTMYKAAPKGKGANKGGTGKPRTVEKEKRDAAEPAKAVKATPADIAKLLWGVADDESVAAVEWIQTHMLRVMNFVKDNIEFDAKPTTKPLRQRKAA